jgi:hypothetical protein
VVDLSEGGIGIETTLAIKAGDPVRIRLFPKRRVGSVELQGIAWNRRKRGPAAGRGAIPVVGFMLSDPPQAYLELLERQSGRDQQAQRLARLERMAPPIAEAPLGREATPSPEAPSSPSPVVEPAEPLQVVEEPPQDSALPRPKFPLPPPKPSAEEALPAFRVRVKQTSGPRTRRLTIRAQSEQDAARRVELELGRGWEILELSSVATPETDR